jgi:hypothetical protein
MQGEEHAGLRLTARRPAHIRKAPDLPDCFALPALSCSSLLQYPITPLLRCSNYFGFVPKLGHELIHAGHSNSRFARTRGFDFQRR